MNFSYLREKEIITKKEDKIKENINQSMERLQEVKEMFNMEKDKDGDYILVTQDGTII